MRELVDRIAALLAALLPRRVWDDWNLPVANMSLPSALLTFFAGAAYGITGYFQFMEAALQGREFTAPPLMVAVFISYVLLTPRGLVALYLAFSGALRAISGWTGEPMGDPLLTLADEVARRGWRAHRHKSAQRSRHALEGADEPDRRYDGAWAGLSGVDFVIVSARRKPGWSKGTFVITDDGWFVLGEPFDRPMPQGLRTVYPLSALKTLDVLRKGVGYSLPPLRAAAGPGSRRTTAPPHQES